MDMMSTGLGTAFGDVISASVSAIPYFSSSDMPWCSAFATSHCAA